MLVDYWFHAMVTIKKYKLDILETDHKTSFNDVVEALHLLVH